MQDKDVQDLQKHTNEGQLAVKRHNEMSLISEQR